MRVIVPVRQVLFEAVVDSRDTRVEECTDDCIVDFCLVTFDRVDSGKILVVKECSDQRLVLRSVL